MGHAVVLPICSYHCYSKVKLVKKYPGCPYKVHVINSDQGHAIYSVKSRRALSHTDSQFLYTGPSGFRNYNLYMKSCSCVGRARLPLKPYGLLPGIDVLSVTYKTLINRYEICKCGEAVPLSTATAYDELQELQMNFTVPQSKFFFSHA